MTVIFHPLHPHIGAEVSPIDRRTRIRTTL